MVYRLYHPRENQLVHREPNHLSYNQERARSQYIEMTHCASETLILSLGCSSFDHLSLQQNIKSLSSFFTLYLNSISGQYHAIQMWLLIDRVSKVRIKSNFCGIIWIGILKIFVRKIHLNCFDHLIVSAWWFPFFDKIDLFLLSHRSIHQHVKRPSPIPVETIPPGVIKTQN